MLLFLEDSFKLYGISIRLFCFLFLGLRLIFGLNFYRSFFICNALGIGNDVMLNFLVENFLVRAREVYKVVPRFWLFERFLRQKLVSEMALLLASGSYRSFRHRRRLPSRGQRVGTNARTVRVIRSYLPKK